VSLIGTYLTAESPRLQTHGRRCASAALVTYGIYRIAFEQPTTASELIWIVVRSLLAYGLVYGSALISFAVIAFLSHNFYARLHDAIIGIVSTRQREAQRRREAAARAEQIQRAHEEYERAAPDRERSRAEEAERARAAAELQARREDIRAHCDYLYQLYCPEIEDRFSRNKFNDFVSTYLNDRRPVDVVERHAGHLRSLLDMHMKKTDPRAHFKSLRDLLVWKDTLLAHINALDDDLLKSTLIANLNERVADLSCHLIEESSP
jgi:hypothetical protein